MPVFEYNFEWDAWKAATNIQKHGVSFEKCRDSFSGRGGVVFV